MFWRNLVGFGVWHIGYTPTLVSHCNDSTNADIYSSKTVWNHCEFWGCLGLCLQLLFPSEMSSITFFNGRALLLPAITCMPVQGFNFSVLSGRWFVVVCWWKWEHINLTLLWFKCIFTNQEIQEIHCISFFVYFAFNSSSFSQI